MLLFRRPLDLSDQEVRGPDRRNPGGQLESRPIRRTMVPGTGEAPRSPYADRGQGGLFPAGYRAEPRHGAPARVRTQRYDQGPVGPLAALLELRARLSGAAQAAERAARSPQDRARAAEQLAGAVLGTLGLMLPPVRWVRGSDAHALGAQITMGTEHARTLSVATLMQILLHEAGHVHEGHSDVLTNLILQALVQEGALHPSLLRVINQSEERTADVYAAIGAWLSDPGERPAMARWLQALGHGATDTHPSSAERARNISLIVRALDAAL